MKNRVKNRLKNRNREYEVGVEQLRNRNQVKLILVQSGMKLRNIAQLRAGGQAMRL